ncbi:aromatic amino acid lyase [Candidatus Woesebacteria bacterium]|nr:aromatic amino acid lyase [Candidatus Woesebacteria bacterium]
MKNHTYNSFNIIEIAQLINSFKKTVDLDGQSLTIQEIFAVGRKKTKAAIHLDTKQSKRLKDSFQHMMSDIENGVPVYGCNTGFGARASRVLVDGTKQERLKMAKMISEGIVHVDVTVGPKFDTDVVRAAMLIRANMLLKGVSAVKQPDIEKLISLLNHQITPIVSQYGGIGASGDLAHNARVLSALRQLSGTKVLDKQGKIVEAKKALKKAGITPLVLDPKAGLGFVNGDNFSSALTTFLVIDTINLLMISFVLGAMVIEVLKGTDRSFHKLLENVRPHPGHAEAASIFRHLLNGSKLAYQEMSGHQLRPKGVKVQDGYSLRCLAQYQGINIEKIKHNLDIITININSSSDNPLWVAPEFTNENEEPWQWVSGGNFIAMNMVEVADSTRKILTQITKLNDRHLARMVSPHENNGLPANLSDKDAITQCAFKGIQIQSGMFDVYSSLLSIPVSTFFGVHEEGNQDITSHALTSGILGLENLRVARYSCAQNLLAVAQAVDLRGGSHLLSSKTRPMYNFLRSKTNYVTREEPLGGMIEDLYQSIVNGEMITHVMKEIYQTL